MGLLYNPVPLSLSPSLYLFSFSLYSFVVLSLSPVSRLLREETLPSPLIFPLVSIIFLTGFRLSLFFVLFFPVLLLFLFTYFLLVAARSAPSIVMRWSATYVRPVKACETTCPNISSANWTLGIFPGADDIYNSCWGVRAVSTCQAIEEM